MEPTAGHAQSPGEGLEPDIRDPGGALLSSLVQVPIEFLSWALKVQFGAVLTGKLYCFLLRPLEV